MVLSVTLNPALDRILILNRLLVNRLHRLEDNEVSTVMPGGKGVNIALSLHNLGEEVITSGFAGGHAGHILCEALRQKGITTSFVFTSGETRTDISIIERSTESLTQINDAGQAVEESDLAFFLENYDRLLQRAEVVLLSGSLPTGVPDEIYHTLTIRANKVSRKVILHASPKLTERAGGASPFVINPDMRSDNSLSGEPLDSIQQMVRSGKDLLEKNRGSEFALLTHKIENIVAVTRSGAYILRPKELKRVNMLGYGSAYLAGFVHAFLKKLPVQEMLRYASAAALAVAESESKELESRDQVTANLARIGVEELQ
jgi:1-phosphofructokinase family hexose kinase